jgi:diguanylate cyclase (GGDEF)-like protein
VTGTGGQVRPVRDASGRDEAQPHGQHTQTQTQTKVMAAVAQARERLRAAMAAPEHLLTELAAAISALVEAPAAVALVELPGAGGGRLVRRAVAPPASGDAPALAVGVPVVTAGTVCGEALRSGRPVRVVDVVDVPDGPHAAACCPGARSLLSVPVIAGGRVVGVVAAFKEQPRWFEPMDERAVGLVVQLVAGHLADLPPYPFGATAPAGPVAPTPPIARATPTVEALPLAAGPGTQPGGAWRIGSTRPPVAATPATAATSAAAAIATAATAATAARIIPEAHPGGMSPRGPARRAEGTPQVAQQHNPLHARQRTQQQSQSGSAHQLTVTTRTASDRPPPPSPRTAPTASLDILDIGLGDSATGGRGPDAADPVLRRGLAALGGARDVPGLGVFEWRPGSGRLAWSRELHRILGLDPAVCPTPALARDLVHPQDLRVGETLLGLVQRAARGSEAAAAESFRVVGPDGAVRHLQVWAAAALDEAGDLVVHGAAVDVTRQARDRVLLERLSATDAVTGLGNRLAFDRRMQERLAAGGEVALLLLDLDRFKLVNDSLGHQVGDRLLVEVARRLTGVVPKGSITARMGGDEFVVVPPPGFEWLHVRRLAQTLVDTLRTPYVLPDSGEILVCPASIGLTSSAGRDASADELLSEADLALYRAKDNGRDRYVVYDDALRARARARHNAELLLRSALEEDRLKLQYQPIVDFEHGRIVGAEALVRILDAGGERLLAPDAFIEVAEDTGLVVELDLWVIDAAIAQLAHWLAGAPSGDAVPWVAVNVSARSMEHPRVVRRLLDGMQRHRIGADHLKVELTEHSFLGTLPGGEGTLRQLLASGVPVGIDDFGTGYSAMAYLNRFDLDFMKIDRSFVAKVGEEDRADAVVTAIVDLAHAHGMQVTAEGVETVRQARRLREIGCDFAQGYHFGRPVDAARLLRV